MAKTKKRLVVRQAFGHDGVYYTTDNIADAPEAVVKKYLKSGAVVEEEVPVEEAPDAEPKK